MKIIRVVTKEVISQLGSYSSFNNKAYPDMKISVELQCVKINNVLIPLSNIKEIVIEETKEEKPKTKKAE